MPAYGAIRPYSAFRSSSVVWWPIGTSITQGIEGGYRRGTFQALQAAGKSPTTVGGLLTASYGGDPTKCGTYHNGNAGATAANWVSSYYGTYVAGLQATPNLITIELGPNDPDSSASGDKIGGDMVDLAAASFPLANILVFLAMDRNGVAPTLINAAITSAVALRKTRGYHVDIVDMQRLQAPQLDGLHPSPTGYDRIASQLSAELTRFF
jgi:lysophospholipase L1-like esterase